MLRRACTKTISQIGRAKFSKSTVTKKETVDMIATPMGWTRQVKSVYKQVGPKTRGVFGIWASGSLVAYTVDGWTRSTTLVGDYRATPEWKEKNEMALYRKGFKDAMIWDSFWWWWTIIENTMPKIACELNRPSDDMKITKRHDERLDLRYPKSKSQSQSQ